MALPEKAKVAVLLLITAACLITIFTSPSITMWDANMRVLPPQGRQFCKVPRKRVSECENSMGDAAGEDIQDRKKKNCNSLVTEFQKCETIVKRAYRNINLGRCPFQIKSLTLCEDEWCENKSAEGLKSCAEECAGVRESLTTCIEQTVLDSFRRNGLNEDGTVV